MNGESPSIYFTQSWGQNEGRGVFEKGFGMRSRHNRTHPVAKPLPDTIDPLPAEYQTVHDPAGNCNSFPT